MSCHHEKALQSVFKALSEIFKSGIEVLLEEASRAAAKQAISSMGTVTNTNIKSSLNAYMKRAAQGGYGRFEICELKLEEARMRVRVWNNIFAEMQEKETTYCTYVAGLLSGIYEELLHACPKVKETKCIRHGGSYCEFLLAPK